jgi:uncharacterized membrane protein YfcA
MDFTTVLGLIVIGLAAGFLGGLMGVGGGIIIVPALVIFLSFTQQQAQATSLAVLLLPVQILAVINYYKAGFVNVKVAAVIVIASVIGMYYGSSLALQLPSDTLKKVFGGFIILVGLKFLFGK